MRINFLKIDIGGRELPNVMLETTKTCNEGLKYHWADIVARMKWSKGGKGGQLLCLAPVKSNIVIKLKKRQIQLNMASEIELSKGAIEFGLHFYLMQDDERKELNCR